MSPPTEVLLVGAGAVGQVLGAHLQRGGAKVTFLVRPAYADATLRGTTLRRGDEGFAFVPDGVLSDVAEVAARRFDTVFLCVSSTALRHGGWLAELAVAAPHATFVAIQPGLEDPAFVGALIPEERLVWGMFPVMAWLDDGVVFYVPPGTKLPFSSSAIAGAFATSGLRAKTQRDVVDAVAFGGAILDMHVIGLECAGFSFDALVADRALLGLVHDGIAEALTIAAHVRGVPAPRPMRWLSPWMSRLALRLAPSLMPFDVERYFRNHFNKVGDQTLAGLDTQLRIAAGAKLPSLALTTLRGRLRSLRQIPLEKAS